MVWSVVVVEAIPKAQIARISKIVNLIFMLAAAAAVVVVDDDCLFFYLFKIFGITSYNTEIMLIAAIGLKMNQSIVNITQLKLNCGHFPSPSSLFCVSILVYTYFL